MTHTEEWPLGNGELPGWQMSDTWGLWWEMDTEREARTRPRGDLGAIMGGIMTPKRCAETLGFPWWFSGLDSGLPLQETWVRSLARELGSRGGGYGNLFQYFCLENHHGQRSLAGYSPWGCKESDMTEWLSTCFFFLLTPVLADKHFFFI